MEKAETAAVGREASTQVVPAFDLVHRLRDKVDKGFPAPMIHTVRGMGYVLRAADSEGVL